MTNEAQGATIIPVVERIKPKGPSHPMADQSVLNRATEVMGGRQRMIPLVDFLKDAAEKGQDPIEVRKAHNPHTEEFIIRGKGRDIEVVSLFDLQERLRSLGVDIDILGLHSIGNPNQRVNTVVQGVDPNNPKSGYERPTLEEGPHMILAPFALDSKGEIHLFRNVQLRKGEAVIDTQRGFADKSSLESGDQMYEIEGAGEQVKKNLTRIIGEEAGKQLLQIKRIVFLGSAVVNTTFVESKSALFGVEVDYNNFVQSNKVVDEEEFLRRREQFEHEGITGVVLDMPLDQYVNYKRNSDISSRDLSADAGTDIVVIDFLADRLNILKDSEQHVREAKLRQKRWLYSLKQRNPAAYKELMEERAAEVKKA